MRVRVPHTASIISTGDNLQTLKAVYRFKAQRNGFGNASLWGVFRELLIYFTVPEHETFLVGSVFAFFIENVIYAFQNNI